MTRSCPPPTPSASPWVREGTWGWVGQGGASCRGRLRPLLVSRELVSPPTHCGWGGLGAARVHTPFSRAQSCDVGLGAAEKGGSGQTHPPAQANTTTTTHSSLCACLGRGAWRPLCPPCGAFASKWRARVGPSPRELFHAGLPQPQGVIRHPHQAHRNPNAPHLSLISPTYTVQGICRPFWGVDHPLAWRARRALLLSQRIPPPATRNHPPTHIHPYPHTTHHTTALPGPPHGRLRTHARVGSREEGGPKEENETGRRDDTPLPPQGPPRKQASKPWPTLTTASARAAMPCTWGSSWTTSATVGVLVGCGGWWVGGLDE